MRKVHPDGPGDLARLGVRGLYTIAISAEDHWTAIEFLFKKYADRPISLADTCLIRCAEMHDERRIATFDADFSGYRWRRNRRFELL